MREDLSHLVHQASAESAKTARVLQSDRWKGILADIDEMLPLNERVPFFRWGARSGTSGYGILLVTTRRVLFNDSINGTNIRISDIAKYDGYPGMYWPQSRDSFLDIVANVGRAGELHVDYSNGAPVRNDETYRAATIAPSRWATVEIIEQPAKPQLRNEWQGRQAAAERAAAEQARTRD